MNDPKLDPNYGEPRCPECGDILTFLLTDLCPYCAKERDEREIERLQARVAELERLSGEVVRNARSGAWCRSASVPRGYITELGKALQDKGGA